MARFPHYLGFLPTNLILVSFAGLSSYLILNGAESQDSPWDSPFYPRPHTLSDLFYFPGFNYLGLQFPHSPHDPGLYPKLRLTYPSASPTQTYEVRN